MIEGVFLTDFQEKEDGFLVIESVAWMVSRLRARYEDRSWDMAIVRKHAIIHKDREHACVKSES